jgi:hypothetical protein
MRLQRSVSIRPSQSASYTLLHWRRKLADRDNSGSERAGTSPLKASANSKSASAALEKHCQI